MSNYYANAQRLMEDIFSTDFDEETDTNEVEAEKEWLEEHDEDEEHYIARPNLDQVRSELGIEYFSRDLISYITNDRRINETSFDDAMLRFLRHIEPSDNDDEETVIRKKEEIRQGATLTFPGPIEGLYSEYALHSAKIKGIDDSIIAHVTYVPDPREPDTIFYRFIPDNLLEHIPNSREISTLITLCRAKGIERIYYGDDWSSRKSRLPKKVAVDEVPKKRQSIQLPVLEKTDYTKKPSQSVYKSIVDDRERIKEMERKQKENKWIK